MTRRETNESPRRQKILEQLKADMERLYGFGSEHIDPESSFIAMGADSLLLIQASQSVEERFGIRVPFRLLMDEVDTLSALAEHLDQRLGDEAPAEIAEEPAPAEADTRPAPTTAPVFESGERPAASSALERLIEGQLEVMAQQLAALRGGAVAPSGPSKAAAPSSKPSPKPSPKPAGGEKKPVREAGEAPTSSAPGGTPARSGGIAFTPEQQRWVDGLVERLSRRTATTRALAERHRYPLADGRTPARLRREWKDICFQVVAERAEGGRIWDLDGNEYVDITMGYGALLFGHSPPFLIDALEDHARRGMRLGPQNEIAGEVAELIRDLTGVDRVSFFNSGTEAVMAAVRMARTVTGRDKIVMFSGSYHGSFDAVMARAPDFATDDRPRALPAAPGVPANTLEDVMVLEFAPESLEVLRRYGHELAAILIEPKQSRRPELELGEFLHQVREIADECGAALLFDEVITGFRTHPGGIQALYDVRADLVTYGKAVGAGMPIGVVAGKERFMDAIDGGSWSFDDDSFPRAEMTAVRGTFFKHPLVMTVARGALRYLKERGPALQEELSERTAALVRELDQIFEEEDVAVRVNHFKSLFIFGFHPSFYAADWDLFFHQLLEKGVYVWEQRVCYLSTGHTEDDVAHVVAAVRETVREMKAAGFLQIGRGERRPAAVGAK